MANQPTSGSDLLFGTFSADIIKAGGGNDVVAASGGADKVSGNDGRDTLSGGLGNDLLKGGNGADILLGGFGDDTIFGGDGADIINGGFGNDILYGSNRSDVDNDMDVFVFGKLDGHDQVRNFEVGVDKISLVGFFGSASFDYDLGTGNTTMTWGLTTVVFKNAEVDSDDLFML